MTPPSITFRSAFGVGEFRALWLAQVFSLVGDQLARVALGVLVYARTSSALWTAVTYAISFLPWLAGGPVLAALADRLPRRAVMVVCDLARALLVAAMTLPGVPLWLLIGLLFVTELFAPPFDAARSATLAVILPGDRFVVGAAVSSVTFQVGQVAGFLVGGVLVATLGTQVSLGLDAATFAVSALLLAIGLRGRPAPTAGTEQAREGVWHSVAGGFRLVLGDSYLRILLGLAWLAAWYVVPQGLAVPYAAELGGSPAVVGLLLAAYPVGMSIGSIVFSRWVDPDRRLRLIGPLAVTACAVLIVCVARPGLIGLLVVFGISGAASAYQLAASAAFVARVPDHMLGRAFGLAQAGLSIGQGVAVVLAGALAEVVRPSTVVSGSGVLGVLVAVPLAVAWYRRRPSAPT